MIRNLLSPLLLLLPSVALADWQVNLPKGVTEISQEVYSIHMLMFWVCVAIGVVVFGIMFYAMFMHRKSRGAKAANFHESTVVEIIWTAIPVLILVVLAVPAVKTLASIYKKEPAELTVVVTGYQWKWHYEYLDESDTGDQGFGYFSVMDTPMDQIQNQADKGEHYLLEVDEPLVVPVDTQIRFLLTAGDVIHSWWVPALAVKKDALPGIVNEAWTKINEPGTYRGQCAELCGKDHGFMPIVVKAVSKEEYAQWHDEKLVAKAREEALSQQDFSMDELIARGESVYQKNCAACHQANGMGLSGVFPAINGSELVMNDRPGHIDIVLNGKAGSAMAAFSAQLSDLDLASVITYQRNAWDNKLGDKVTVVDILDAKNGQ